MIPKILLLCVIFLHFSQAIIIYPRGTFKIVLDNKNEVYAAGDDVKGNLVLTTPGNSVINNVALRFVGEAYAQATYGEKFGSYRSDVPTFFNESKIFVNQQLLDKSKEFKYPFSFKIPANSLTSAEAFPAKIRYGLELIIGGTDDEIEIPVRYLITVINGIDLSKSDEYSKAASCQASDFGVNIKATIEKTGFVDGENIPVKVEIDNQSNDKTDYIHAKLVVNKTSISKKNGKTFKFGDAAPIPEDSREIRTREYDTTFKLDMISVPPKSKGTFTLLAKNFEPTIPSYAPKTLPPFLKINHRFEIIVKSANKKNTISCSIPVTIGVVPTKDVKSKKPSEYLGDGKDVLINSWEHVQEGFKPKYPKFKF
ncbi:unnamed protein product [Caenorhabditis angaria]|uniref:Arrestin C-terminal-like domain-containing protein n=1 Tax=Caenorhabditis angaria TaxID=860376 RepID=A0A9P1IDD4_9PELO|nr:unnamed protein product [Caenorhabditis angaria]